MRKILFVLPALTHGGSNKSLETLLKLLYWDDAEMLVSSLSVDEEQCPYYEVFREKLIKLSFLYQICIRYAIIRKTLNAIQNFLNIDIWSLVYSLEAKYQQRKHRFDVVVGFEESYATKFASFFPCRKKVAWMHCEYKYYKVYSGNRDEHRIYSRFSDIICVSDYCRKVFIEEFPELKDRVCFIYNLLDIDTIKEKSRETVEDNMFSQEKDEFKILSIGRFVEIKQFHRIPDWVRDIKKEFPHQKFCWYIIGDGDKTLVQYTKNRIKEYGIENNLKLLGYKQNPYNYLCNSSLFVCTSKSESFSYVVFEAKALGVPYLSLDFPVAQELYDSSCGALTSEDNLVTSICCFMNHGEGIDSSFQKRTYDYVYDNELILNKIRSVLS